MNIKFYRQEIFIFDFSGALVVGLIYVILFNFLLTTLALPEWLLLIQIAANFIYGFYGFVLYLSQTNRIVFFKFLVAMNYAYSLFAGLVSVFLLLQSSYLGSILLIAECIYIGLLAFIEQKSILD